MKLKHLYFNAHSISMIQTNGRMSLKLHSENKNFIFQGFSREQFDILVVGFGKVLKMEWSKALDLGNESYLKTFRKGGNKITLVENECQIGQILQDNMNYLWKSLTQKISDAGHLTVF